MQSVYTAPNASMIHLIKDMLEQRGIETSIRGEALLGAAGELAPVDTWVELLVVEDRDETVARRLIDEFINAEETGSTETWQCHHCGEHIESQFGVCWRCGKPRER